MLAIMPASIGPSESRKSPDLALAKQQSNPETLQRERETENTLVAYEPDKFKVSNLLKRPAAMAPVAQ